MTILHLYGRGICAIWYTTYRKQKLLLSTVWLLAKHPFQADILSITPGPMHRIALLPPHRTVVTQLRNESITMLFEVPQRGLHWLHCESRHHREGPH